MTGKWATKFIPELFLFLFTCLTMQEMGWARVKERICSCSPRGSSWRGARHPGKEAAVGPAVLWQRLLYLNLLEAFTVVCGGAWLNGTKKMSPVNHLQDSQSIPRSSKSEDVAPWSGRASVAVSGV